MLCSKFVLPFEDFPNNFLSIHSNWFEDNLHLFIWFFVSSINTHYCFYNRLYVSNIYDVIKPNFHVHKLFDGYGFF